MLYYKKNIVPNTKPYRLRLSDGTTVTNPTHEQLLENGWLVAPDQPEYSYPQTLFWKEPNWIVKDPGEEEIASKWEEVRRECVERLAATDYKVIKAVEATAVNGTSISDELEFNYVIYRQAIRDIYNNVNNLDPFFINWPTLEETVDGN
jgi:hypothetical protein